MSIATPTIKLLTSDPLRYNTIEEAAERFQLDSNLRQQIFGISPRNQVRTICGSGWFKFGNSTD